MASADEPSQICVGTSVKQVPVALSSAKNECGLACLAMLMGYYDGVSDLSGLRQRYGETQQGLTMKQLALMAGELGYLSRGLRTEPSQLGLLQKPAILHWQMDHFVLLVSVRKRGCVVHDPARGRVLVSWHDMDRSFTGVVLELWPAGGELATARAPRLNFSQLLAMAGGFDGALLWLVLLSFALQGFVLISPWHMQWTVDEALVKGDVHLIGVLCIGFGFVLICRSLAHYLRGLLVLHLGYRMSFTMACRLFQHLLHLPLRWYEARHIGDIASRFNALHPFRALFTQGIASALVDLIMLLLSGLLMMVYSIELGLLVIVWHSLLLLIQLAWIPKLKRLTQGAIVAQADEQASLLESISTVHNVKVYRQEQTRLAQWQTRHVQFLAHSLDLERLQLGLGSLHLSATGLELLFTIYVASNMVMEGALTLGMLFAFISYRGHFSERLRSLTDQLINLRTLPTHIDRLSEVCCADLEPSSTTTLSHSNPLKANLQLKNVGVADATSSRWLLKDINLNVPYGAYIGVLGASGSGKTTLLKLMMGLVPPASGDIFLGEQNLAVVGAAGLRARSGSVLQADSFFSGSVVDNVTLFEPPDWDMLRGVLAAVDMTSALDKLPMGWHTPLGDMGAGFSTGQLQRLLLARALYRCPDYLFLDECTANLDSDSAAKIQALVACMSCTRVVVAHDVDLLTEADHIYEMKEGRLVDYKARNVKVPSAG